MAKCESSLCNFHFCFTHTVNENFQGRRQHQPKLSGQARAAELSCGTVYYAVQGSPNF